MEELTYEYDWRHPIEVPNSKNKSGVSKENGSFEWFKYWLNNGCTYQQIADKFNTSKTTVANISKLFKWKERKRNRDNYISRQQDLEEIEEYNKFKKRTRKEVKQEIDITHGTLTILGMIAGIIPNNGQYELPENKTEFVKIANAIFKSPVALKTSRADFLRSVEQAATINDKQKVESENINTNLNLPVKSTEEVVNEHADTFERFIERRLHISDEDAD